MFPEIPYAFKVLIPLLLLAWLTVAVFVGLQAFAAL